jgi:hypothetical protein
MATLGGDVDEESEEEPEPVQIIAFSAEEE